MHQGGRAKHKYHQFQTFALGDGIIFHILFKSDKNKAREVQLCCMNMLYMRLSLEMKRFEG